MKYSIVVRKSESLTRLIVLVFLGVALHSLIIFTPVLDSLKNPQAQFFTEDVLITYLVVLFGYSIITSLYVSPIMVISPYYIQLGTAGFILFMIVTRLVVTATDVTNVTLPLIILFMEFALFIALGFGLSLFLRKMIGMNGDRENIWNETYRIEADYKLIKKKIFDDIYFEKFNIDRSEENNVITVKRKYSFPADIRIFILLQPNPKIPNESVLSISACETKFESMWKTENAEKILIMIRRIINSTLSDNYKIELILDKDENTVSSKCDLLLLESMQSPVSRISKFQRRPLIGIIGLIVLGIVMTILPYIYTIQGTVTLHPDTLISIQIATVTTWVTIATTMVLLLSAEIKAKISKNPE